MQAIGYKELAAAVTGRGPSGAALELEVKLRSRQYAKRQLTWFRRDRSIQWFKCAERRRARYGGARRFVTEKNDRIWNTTAGDKPGGAS